MAEATARAVYHLVPSNMWGSTLHPLNRLRSVHPDVAQPHEAKYHGREALRAVRIPGLDCLWNDVLMFSPVHPTEIVGAVREVGLSVRPLRWLVVPEGLLAPERTVILLPRPDQPLSSPVRFQPLPYTSAGLDAFSAVPDAHRQYLKSLAPGSRPLLFAQIAHVMHLGSLDIEGLEVLET